MVFIERALRSRADSDSTVAMKAVEGIFRPGVSSKQQEGDKYADN
jgi:hypothetical protein